MFSIQKHGFAIGSVAVAAVLVLVLNLGVNQMFPSARVDFTEHDLYSLSDGSKRILKNLTEPVTLRYFVSRSEIIKLPGINAFAARVEDFLSEYERLAGGMINLRIIEPESFSEDEDTAVGYGLQGFPTNDGRAYFGLVGTNSVDDTRIIELFLPEREQLLEYDLTRLIHLLDQKDRKVVGIISTLPLQGIAGDSPGMAQRMEPWTIYLQLSEMFDARILPRSTETLPDDLDMLALINPRNLSDNMFYEIDQYVLKGGKLLLVVDPHSEVLAALTQNIPGLPAVDIRSDLNRLSRNWGVTLREGSVVGDLPIAARVLESDGPSGQTVDYPVWMNVQPGQLNSEDVVTSELGNLILATSGVLDIEPASTLNIVPLIVTTPAAKIYDQAEFAGATDLKILLDQYQGGGEQLVLAVRINGEATSVFPDGRPKNEGNENSPETSESTLSKGQINVIMVADSDFMQDHFWIAKQQFQGSTLTFAQASNGEFVHNAVDNLTGDDNLIGVRSRGSYFRPFQRLQEIRQAAEQEYLEQEQLLLVELGSIENLLVDYGQAATDAQGGKILTEEQRDEIKSIRESQLEFRKQLREVRRNLRKDIERLESNVRMMNVFVVPILVVIAGTIVGTFGARRRERRLATEVVDLARSQ